MKYDETSIRVLTHAELESHSADSILAILLNEYSDTSPDHLSTMAECLITFGWSVEEYRLYRNGTLENNKLETMNLFFREMNRTRKY
ncbi:hypothetical protein [Enterobacter roggenkampii]|uniref:hypothetical protein n=1 Tax=Enterobacter roggenkampii TaxID=1812935 RepID=UPI001C70860B|nr:hypothetical protein [Enterobacter roggenkampii]MBW9467657.1 hypothetical protein [Enterobacter roggenkampii]